MCRRARCSHRSIFHRPDEFGEADIEGADDASNGEPSGVGDAALDASERRNREAGAKGHGFLGGSAVSSQAT